MSLTLTDLHRQHLRLRRVVAVQSALLAAALCTLLVGCRPTQGSVQTHPAQSSLRVHELVIVDEAGVERVRIGGELPDAIIGGQRAPRGDEAAGVILYDSTGAERGGYVTFDESGNVGLTLDTRQQQATLFVAGPDGGSALQLWHGNDSVELRSDGEGSRITLVRDGRVLEQNPPVKAISAEACAEYTAALKQYPLEFVLQECRRRYTEAACQECLKGR